MTAADAPVAFAEQFPVSARLLLGVRREDVPAADVPGEVATELSELERHLVAVLVRPSAARWGRRDAVAVRAQITMRASPRRGSTS